MVESSGDTSRLGNCHICGRCKPLTFEHTPPRSAYNEDAIQVLGYDDWTAWRVGDTDAGDVQKGGTGEFTMCGKCNNERVGSRYGTEYVRWAQDNMQRIREHEPHHACRVAYINMVIESGVTVKEAQELARHSTPQLTMNVYGRARPERLIEAVEKVGETVLQTVNRAPYVHRMAVGAEQATATPLPTRGCVSKKLVAAEGFEPQTDVTSKTTEPSQNCAKPKPISALEQLAGKGDKQKNALSIQDQSISSHPKCATYVQQDSEDLAAVVEAWRASLTKQKQGRGYSLYATCHNM